MMRPTRRTTVVVDLQPIDEGVQVGHGHAKCWWRVARVCSMSDDFGSAQRARVRNVGGSVPCILWADDFRVERRDTLAAERGCQHTPAQEHDVPDIGVGGLVHLFALGIL